MVTGEAASAAAGEAETGVHTKVKYVTIEDFTRAGANRKMLFAFPNVLDL